MGARALASTYRERNTSRKKEIKGERSGYHMGSEFMTRYQPCVKKGRENVTR